MQMELCSPVAAGAVEHAKDNSQEQTMKKWQFMGDNVSPARDADRQADKVACLDASAEMHVNWEAPLKCNMDLGNAPVN